DEEGVIEVISAPSDYAALRNAFEAAGLKAEVDGIVMKPLNETELTGDDAAKMQKLLDALEALDDVQEVNTTVVFDEAQCPVTGAAKGAAPNLYAMRAAASSWPL